MSVPVTGITQAQLRTVGERGVFTPAHAAALSAGIVADPNSEEAEMLAFRLNELALDHAFNLWTARIGSTDALERAQKIRKACATILHVSGIWDERKISSDILPGIGDMGLFAAAAVAGEQSGREAVVAAMTQVSKLRNWARALEDHEVKRAKILPKSAHRRTDRASKLLLCNIGHFYRQIFGVEPAIPSDRILGPHGPFLDFVTGIIEHLSCAGLAKIKSKSALEIAWRRTLSDPAV